MRSFIMHRSRSARLFVKGTSGSCRQHHFATQRVRRRHSVCALAAGAPCEQPHGRPGRRRDRVLFIQALRLPKRIQGELAGRLLGQRQEDSCANRLRHGHYSPRSVERNELMDWGREEHDEGCLA